MTKPVQPIEPTFAELEHREMRTRITQLEEALKPFANFDIPQRVTDTECIYTQFPARLFRTAKERLSNAS